MSFVQLMLVLFVILGLAVGSEVTHEAGNCGRSTIPYKIVINRDGRPEMFCDRPPCFGGRRGPFASCSRRYLETVCVESNQWTGGIVEVTNRTHRTMRTECCQYNPISSSPELRTIKLEKMESFEGGIVEADSFDFIKEIRKTIRSSDGEVEYIIKVYRLPCQGADPVTFKRGRSRQKPVAGSEEYDEESRRTTSRGRRGLRRRGRPYRPVDDYEYEYDYDYPVRRFRRPRPQERMWPVAYARGERTKVKGTVTYEEPAGAQSYSAAGPEPPTGYADVSQSITGMDLPLQSTREAGYASAGAYPAPPPPAYPSASYPQPPTQQVVQARQPVYQQQVYQPAVYQPAPAPAPAYYPAPAYPSYPSYSPGSYGYSYPSSGGASLNGIFDQMQCFSGDMEVQTSEGVKAVKDLEIGDMVLSVEQSMLTYSPVVMFLHKLADEPAQFNQLTTESGELLKLTDMHLIYVSECVDGDEVRLVPAKDVKVGDCVHVLHATQFEQSEIIQDRVTNITKVAEVGIYAPLTANGDLMINNVLASCHSNLALKTLQQSFFAVYRGVRSWYDAVVPSVVRGEEDGELPAGIRYMTTIVEHLVPKHF